MMIRTKKQSDQKDTLREKMKWMVGTERNREVKDVSQVFVLQLLTAMAKTVRRAGFRG